MLLIKDMHMNNGFGKKAILLSLCCLISSPLAAQAGDFESMMRSFLGASKSTVNPATQNVIKTNINTRQAQLEQEIQAGVTSGQLSPQEESDLRADLNQIAGLEGQYLMDGQLDNMETQHLLDELTRLTQKLQTYLTNATTVGTGTARHGDWFRKYGGPNGGGRQQERIAHLDAKRAELDSRIEQGVVSGYLNPGESANLRNQLTQVSIKQSQMTADGRLSYDEQNEILNQLNLLETQISTAISSGEQRARASASNWGGHGRGKRRDWEKWRQGNGVNEQQSLLKQRIYSGIKSGKLTPSEANMLLSKEQQIANLEARLRSNSSGMLTYDQSRVLHQQLSDLSRDINKQLRDKQVW